MRLDRSRKSSNIEDRRGARSPIGRGKIGIGTIVLALVAIYFGVDPSVVLQGFDDTGTTTTQNEAGPPVQKPPSVRLGGTQGWPPEETAMRRVRT